MPGMEADVSKGADHVLSLPLACLRELICYYYQLKVVNLAKKKKEEIIDEVGDHIRQFTIANNAGA